MSESRAQKARLEGEAWRPRRWEPEVWRRDALHGPLKKSCWSRMELLTSSMELRGIGVASLFCMMVLASTCQVLSGVLPS